MIKAAPYSFFICVLLVGLIAWLLIWLLFRERFERDQHTIEHQEREIARLEKERQPPTSAVAVSGEPVSPSSFKKPQWERISGHRFVNEEVIVDGKSFYDCSFTNVKFHFRGTAPTEFIGKSSFDGSIVLSTDNPAVMLYTKLTQIFASAPGAEIQSASLDDKGNPVPNSVLFEAVPKIPAADGDGQLLTRVLMFTQKLRHFLRTMGPQPEFQATQGMGDKERFKAASEFHWNKTVPWQDRLHQRFEKEFAEEAKKLRDELSEKNLSDMTLNQYLSLSKPTHEEIADIRKRLVMIALNLD